MSALPSNKFRKATSKLPKANTSIRTQMRTEHIAMRAYLYKFKLAESPTCQQCGTGEESALLLTLQGIQNPTTRTLQKARRQARGKPKAVEFLRGGKHMRWVFQYIRDTARFEESHGKIKVTVEEEEERSSKINEEREEEEEWI